MNIFYLDTDPKKAAHALHDKHVVKMVLETAQMLSTAHRELDKDQASEEVYKSTHKNHPSTKWVRRSNNNYIWAWCLFKELSNEYTYRYGKTHKCWSKLGKILYQPPRYIEVYYKTPVPQCMPDQYKCSNTVQAYRKYYIGEKLANNPKWTKREKPEWIIDHI